MSLAIFNGSPRGPKSNSAVIANWFSDGYTNEYSIYYLNKVKQHPSYIEELHKHDDLMFVFPLYVDGMPAQVKQFMESLMAYRDILAGKKVTYIIHSGFSEGVHCENISQYLQRFSEIFNLKNHGIIVLPGSEGFRLMPDVMTRKKHVIVTQMANNYSKNIAYNSKDLRKLEIRRRMSKLAILLHKIGAKLGLTNTYWNSNLKNNNAFERRFDAPYK